MATENRAKELKNNENELKHKKRATGLANIRNLDFIPECVQ